MCYIVKPNSSARGAAAACIKDDLARQEGRGKENDEIDLEPRGGPPIAQRLVRYIVPIAGELMHYVSLEGFAGFNKRGIGEEMSAEAMRVAFIVICHPI